MTGYVLAGSNAVGNRLKLSDTSVEAISLSKQDSADLGHRTAWLCGAREHDPQVLRRPGERQRWRAQQDRDDCEVSKMTATEARRGQKRSLPNGPRHRPQCRAPAPTCAEHHRRKSV